MIVINQIEEILIILTELQQKIPSNKLWEIKDIKFNRKGAPPTITWKNKQNPSIDLKVMPKITDSSYNIVVAEENIQGTEELVSFNARIKTKKPLDVYAKAYEFAVEFMEETAQEVKNKEN